MPVTKNRFLWGLQMHVETSSRMLSTERHANAIKNHAQDRSDPPPNNKTKKIPMETLYAQPETALALSKIGINPFLILNPIQHLHQLLRLSRHTKCKWR